MKQVFILGRNPKLSREEIISFMRTKEQGFKEIFFNENFFMVESSEEINIQELGGTIKSGKIIFEGDKEDFENFLGKNEIVPSDKFTYAIFGNGNYEVIQNKFKSERKKAVLKHGRRNLQSQDGESLALGKAEYNLFFHEFNKRIYLGEINQEYDYLDIKKRDMEKPVRREALAISPRLAKILLNLSETKQGEHLLDPFCGIGVIVMEALNRGINVTGIDNDRDAIKDAKKNIEWFKQNFGAKSRYTLINADSKNAPDLKFDGIATETPLGELLNKKISDKESKEMIAKFEKKIVPILKRLSRVKKRGGKIAITFPVIKGFSPDEEMIARESNLRIVLEPISEFRPDQFISREILVFE